MDKLKEILGEELYSKVNEKLGDKKLAITNDGNWIPKTKFDDVIKEKNNYKKQLEEIDTDAFEQKKQELWEMEKELTLDKHNLSDFKNFFNAEDSNTLKEQINVFKDILQNKLEENQANNTYKPESHKKNNVYEEAKKKGNVQSMLSQKLSSIFK